MVARLQVQVRVAVCMVLAAAGGARADMYDVLSPQKAPPPACTHGCMAWADLAPAVSATLWAGGRTPSSAGSSCAQPGLAVNEHPTGAWCYCANASAAGAATHPLDGKTYILNTNGAADKFVSFAYTDHPPQEDAAKAWMRAEYKADGAMPMRFEAVSGKANTYLLYNLWPKYQNYVSFDDFGHWLRAIYAKDEAMPITFEPAANGLYTMKNLWEGDETFVGVTGAPYWLRANLSAADATPVGLTEVQPPLEWEYCADTPVGEPTQINLQVASPRAVVVSFVTFEARAPTEPPVVRVTSGSTGAAVQRVTGVTHQHLTAAKDRVYYLHFVLLDGLRARATYTYSVQSGSPDAKPSSEFSFRAPYAHTDGVTRIGVYGDMGVYSWNNMGNLYEDCVVNQDVDLIIQAGDHAYNQGESDERRGDGYMEAWQPVLSRCPWMPVVGNHEFYDGAELGRYLNQTWEGWGPIPGANVTSSGAGPEVLRGRSTATSALGMLLAVGNHQGSGLHGSTPSHTSRFFSVDFGLVHLVALDLNIYYGVDTCGDACRVAQIDWLKADLAAAVANRANVPWIVLMSHYPFYCTGCANKQVSSEFYASDEAEQFGNTNETASRRFEEQLRAGGRGDLPRLWQTSDESIADLIPILAKHQVDLYLAGHWHYYESLWPAQQGKTGTGGAPLQKTFINPNVTVHCTTGNGGPPGKDSFHEDCPGPDCGRIPATRRQTIEFGYGRLTAFNHTHMTFQQVFNANSSLFDEWTIVQTERH